MMLLWCYAAAFLVILLTSTGSSSLIDSTHGQTKGTNEQSTHAPKRNVLIFVVDDGGFEFSFYGNHVTGATHVPNLASRSNAMVFDRAHTAVSSCSPSRSALLSGLPTHQNGMYGLHQFPGNFQSNDDVTSLPNILNAAGYKTGILGKYHVGPIENYNFQYGLRKEHCWAGLVDNTLVRDGNESEYCDGDYNDLSRNVTAMKLRARTFLNDLEPEKPFLLYVGFADCHRCGFENNRTGSFCEFYGSPDHNQGVIPDWSPVFFKPEDVIVPPFLPDIKAVREDIAAQYTAVRRMDTGVGLILDEIKRAGADNDTLVIFFSDNGIPFPSGKTNLFSRQGMNEPMIVALPSSTQSSKTKIRRSNAVVSSLDILPTVLDWTNLKYPINATAGHKPATLTGRSLLSFMKDVDHRRVDDEEDDRAAFASHNFHSLFAYYPTRAIVRGSFRLTHNLMHELSFAILEDVYETTTWKEIMTNETVQQEWIYDYNTYKHRPEWELYDVENDPYSTQNLATNASFASVLSQMKLELFRWRQDTNDPWLYCNLPSEKGICSL